MPKLTRRLTWPDDKNARDTWSIYYDDVSVGGIGVRAGVPDHVDKWGWSVGFYPGMHPGESVHGSASTFQLARIAWAAAWERYLPKCTPEAFEEYRAHKRYLADREAGRLPPRSKRPIIKCACGVMFDTWDPASNQIHAPHVYLMQRANLGGFWRPDPIIQQSLPRS